MLDEHFAARLAEIDRVLDDRRRARASRRARPASRLHAHAARPSPSGTACSSSSPCYAARNEGFRIELVERYRALRERVAELLGAPAPSGSASSRRCRPSRSPR